MPRIANGLASRLHSRHLAILVLSFERRRVGVCRTIFHLHCLDSGH